jgi:cyclic pyranopterin phosphate synthase
VRRADLKTGYDCNSNCVFCVIGDKLFTGNRPFAECVEELRASRQTCDDVVFTGAEVTIRPDFFALVAAARQLGYRNIQIQTNGRMFAYLEFCKKAIAAGANEFSPSIHGHIARLHDGLTRSEGSFDQIVGAIKNLRALGQRIVTNTVATKQNARHLPALARMLVDLGVDQFQIAFPHPTGHAHTYFRGVIPRMSALAPFVHEALAIGRDAGVACMAEAIPYCLMQGWERHVAELHIPPTEIVYDGFVVADYKRDRMDRGKTRFPQCASCRFEPMCEGPWREYPDELGSDEFQPVAGARVADTQVVLDDRFDMLGRPAPRLPSDDAVGHAAGWRDARWLALVFVPEPGTPSCDLQLASVCKLPGAVTISPRPGADLLDDGGWARAYRVIGDGQFRRTTYLIGPERRIDHILVAPDVARHAEQIGDAIRRFEAPARPLERGEELVVLRRTRKPAADVAAELRLTPDHHDFADKA